MNFLRGSLKALSGIPSGSVTEPLGQFNSYIM